LSRQLLKRLFGLKLHFLFFSISFWGITDIRRACSKTLMLNLLTQTCWVKVLLVNEENKQFQGSRVMKREIKVMLAALSV
jgi:hypothetical protein